MVVERGQFDPAVRILDRQRRDVDLRVKEVLDEVAENVRIDQRLDLVAEFELGQDFLDVG